MKKVVYGFIILLAVIHQDVWWWDNGELVFGFMPVGLFITPCIRAWAAGVWAMAVKWAWPSDIEQWAESGDEAGGGMSSITPLIALGQAAEPVSRTPLVDHRHLHVRVVWGWAGF